MGFDPAQFQKRDTVEATLSELEKQSTDLISYFDSFFSTSLDKDKSIIREDGHVEILASQTVTTPDNPDGTSYYFQSSAQRLQQIGDLIATELEEIEFDTEGVGDRVTELLEDTIRDEVGVGDGANLNTILDKNSENFDALVNNGTLMGPSLTNFFNNVAQTDILIILQVLVSVELVF